MADFENVVVDITAEELEERVKKPIDMEARAGSLNLIYSGAVHSAVENVKVRTDNIVDGAVTSSKLGQYSVKTDAIVPSAVTEDKLSRGSVTTDKVAESAITPNELDRVYTESISTPEIASYAQLDEYLTPSDDVGVYNTLYKMSFASSFPLYGVLGNSDYIGFISDRLVETSPTLIIVSAENFGAWSYTKGSAAFNRVVSADQTYSPSSKNAQSGVAVAEAMGTIPDWAKQETPPVVFMVALDFKGLFATLDKYGSNYPIMKVLLALDLEDSVSGIKMPSGNYLCFTNDHSYMGCWHPKSQTLYCVERKHASGTTTDNIVYTYSISSGDVTVNTRLDNIETTLDGVEDLLSNI